MSPSRSRSSPWLGRAMPRHISTGVYSTVTELGHFLQYRRLLGEELVPTDLDLVLFHSMDT